MHALIAPKLHLWCACNLYELFMRGIDGDMPRSLEHALNIRAAHPGDWSEAKVMLLEKAIGRHSPEAVRILLAHGADPNRALMEGVSVKTLLAVVVRMCDDAVAMVPPSAGADASYEPGLSAGGAGGAQAGGMRADAELCAEVVELLVKYGAEMTHPGSGSGESCSG
ncbi:uncharacterized protein H6S33_004520 [Morchella sextelata]|uniref:uncharacterized protein n=1 Tax=Morchella sextelata TaxID=1174677 RepID=UPI001D0546D3|nr:uncharacterized protein H6S33_004520 [Morchella sextelata]KAH0606063.1 hypothetical protein H6S33_004520 [Morchella sextelata]